MQPRQRSKWRAVSTLLGGLAVAALLPTVAVASAPNAQLLRQDAAVTLSASSGATMHATLAVGGTNADGTTLNVALYHALTSRNALDGVINGSGAGTSLLDETGAFPLDCRVRGAVVLTIGLNQPGGSCGGATLRLNLTCRLSGCAGVYPVRYDLATSAGQVSVWSLLTIQAGSNGQPLKVLWVLRDDARSRGAAGQVARNLALLNAVAVPTQLALSAADLSDVVYGTTRGVLLAALHTYFATSHHQLIATAPTSFNFGSLDQNGLRDDVAQQVEVIAELARYVNARVSGTGALYLPGDTSPVALQTLNNAGYTKIILSERALTYPVSNTLHWGTPFRVVATPPSTLAIASDEPLAQLFERADRPSAQLASFVTGTLAMLHYQAPFSPVGKTVTIITSLSRMRPAVTAAVLWGLRQLGVVRLATTTNAFDSQLVGGDHNPAIRVVHGLAPVPWTSADVATVARLRDNLRSIRAMMPSGAPALRCTLDRLRAETVLGSRANAFATARVCLTNLAGNLRVDLNDVTIAGGSSYVPITIYSNAPYPLTALITVRSDRFSFPRGSTYAIVMPSHTVAIRVPFGGVSGVSGIVSVQVRTPDHRVILASGSFQLLNAANATIGYTMSAGSLLVIAWWWWRTSRRRRVPRVG